MRRIKWLLINTAFSMAIYFGLYKEIEGALNIALLWAWFNVCVSPLFLSKMMHELIKRQEARDINVFVSIAFRMTILFTFAWYGYIFLSFGLLFSLIMVEAAYKGAGK